MLRYGLTYLTMVHGQAIHPSYIHLFLFFLSMGHLTCRAQFHMCLRWWAWDTYGPIFSNGMVPKAGGYKRACQFLKGYNILNRSLPLPSSERIPERDGALHSLRRSISSSNNQMDSGRYHLYRDLWHNFSCDSA